MSSQSDVQSIDIKYEVEIRDNMTIVKIPETYNDVLTEAQKEKLLQFEEEFTYRYTDDDNDYVALVKLGSTTPPLVPSYRPFRNRRRDNRSRDDRTRNEKRSWEDQRSYSNNRHENYSHGKRSYYGYNNGYRR